MIGRTVSAGFLLALVAGGPAVAQPGPAAACAPLVVGNPDGNYIVPGAKGAIVYRRVEGRDLALDAWSPGTTGSRVPAVVVVHGGGWVSGSRIAFIGQFLETLSDAGYAWVSVDYRLGGPARSGDAIDDVRTAVAFVRCRASELGVDPDRLVLLGEDTGAFAAAAAIAEGWPGVTGAMLIGGVYAPALPSPRAGARALVVHGTADREAPLATADAWCAAARATGAACDLVPVEGAIHRPENWRPEQWGYKARLVEWLGARVGPGAAVGQRPIAGPLTKRIAFSRTTGLTLDAWTPKGPAPRPAVILVHGGGWEAGDRVTYITPLFEPLAQAGFAWFSIDYRLTPDVRHPDQLADVREAVRFVRADAARFGIDPTRVVLVGESASGQMVAQLATEDASLAGVVSFYGVYDFEPMVTDASPRSLAVRLFGRTVLDEATRTELRRYSPIHHVRNDMPPLLLVHGTNERLWDQGVAMAARLKAVGARHELVRLEGAPHGMENWEGRPEWQWYKVRLVDWLESVTGHGR